MLTTIEGVFRNGKIELLEPAPPSYEGRVVVTFLPSGKPISLGDRGMSPEAAADLRARLQPFSEDWNRPDMDVYDED